MRKYAGEKQELYLLEAKCNCCGRAFAIENGLPKEEIIEVEHVFGFFSATDGDRCAFDLCETCYHTIIKNFTIPVSTEEVTEYL